MASNQCKDNSCKEGTKFCSCSNGIIECCSNGQTCCEMDGYASICLDSKYMKDGKACTEGYKCEEYFDHGGSGVTFHCVKE